MVNITSKEYVETVNYDSALFETKFGKFNYFLIFVAGFVIACPPIEAFTIGYVTPMAQCDFELSSADKGLLNAMVFTGIISSALPWGFLADKTGRQKIITLSLFLASITSALSSFAPNFTLFLICRYFTGFFISGACPTIFVYLAEFHTTNARGRVIMVASFIFSVFFTVLPLLAWLIINQTWNLDIPFLNVTYKPWRLFILVNCLPGFLCGICFLRLPESPKFLLAVGKKEETMKILEKIYSLNTGNSGNTYKVQAIKEEEDDTILRLKTQGSSMLRSAWTQTLELFSKKYLRRALLVCTIQFCIFITAGGMYVWFREILNKIFLHMEDKPNSTLSMCEIVYSFVGNPEDGKNVKCIEQLETATYTHSLISEGIHTIGFVAVGFIINVVGKKIILMSLVLVSGPCGIAAAFINHPMVAIYLYIIFLLSALCITIVHSITVELFPTQIRAMAINVSLIFGRAGSVVGANTIGLLIDTQCEAAFIAAGIALIICAFLTYFIPLKKSGKDEIMKIESVIQ